MKKILKITGVLILLMLLFLAGFLYKNLHNRHPGYALDLKIKSEEETQLKVGFSAFRITPDVPDRWVDKNNDARYSPEDGDTFIDGNGNGKFDPYWMAGFDNRRAANGIHDDLWARSMVIDDGKTKISFTVIDAIGFFHDEVVNVRKRLDQGLGITYSIISSTHTHEAPDLMGMWGESEYTNGIDKAYQEFVMTQIVHSIEEASGNSKPAYFKFAQDLDGLKKLVTDSRKPIVLDDGLRIVQVIDAVNSETIGTLVAWGNHPENLWDKNLLITSDFPHFVRESIEKGIYSNDTLVSSGLGGICIYFNGAIGGLMTSPPEFSITDPWTGQVFAKPSFEKAEAQGKIIANMAIQNLMSQTDTLRKGALQLVAKTINLPLDNPLFRLGASIGLLQRGLSGLVTIQSEIAVFGFGPVSFVTVPGEVYPELVNGGIEAPDGQDFITKPLELPSIRDAMNAEYKFVIGLANDEIGYIIPKSEWDEQAPFIYDYKESPYGEINSIGPDTAPILHKYYMEILNTFHND